ncbi:14284_t:CDS:1, partial [Dentiscutata heterogama]
MAIISLNSCFKTSSDLYLKMFTNAKHRWHRNISIILKKLVPWIPLLIYGLFVGILICFFIIQKDKVLIGLEKLVHKIQTMGIG